MPLLILKKDYYCILLIDSLKKTETYKVLNFVEGEPETKKSPCEHKQLSNGNDSLSVGKLSKT